MRLSSGPWRRMRRLSPRRKGQDWRRRLPCQRQGRPSPSKGVGHLRIREGIGNDVSIFLAFKGFLAVHRRPSAGKQRVVTNAVDSGVSHGVKADVQSNTASVPWASGAALPPRFVATRDASPTIQAFTS